MRYTIILAALMVLLMTPQTARADHNGVVISRTWLHSGPSNNYPRLYTVRANTGLTILGCLSGWNWCEVATGGAHGWISAGALGVRYHGRIRGVPNYAPRLGVPVIGFNERLYWTKYYYDHDFCIKRYGKNRDNRHDNRWSQRDCDYRDRSGQCRSWDRHQDDRGRNWDDDRDDDHDWSHRRNSYYNWDHHNYNN